jgi:hypothetical protein
MSYSSFNNVQTVESAFPTIKETVPRSALGYNSNNQYPEFPPLMMDGRAVVASYQPESAINNNIILENNIQSNWEYRRYLTENAVDVMNRNFRDACNDAGYYTNAYDINGNPYQLTGTPSVIRDPMSSPFVYNQENLTQMPFGYASSDLKDVYLSRDALSEQKNVTQNM